MFRYVRHGSRKGDHMIIQDSDDTHNDEEDDENHNNTDADK